MLETQIFIYIYNLKQKHEQTEVDVFCILKVGKAQANMFILKQNDMKEQINYNYFIEWWDISISVTSSSIHAFSVVGL